MDIYNVDGFEWDDGNIDKNWIKHQVSNFECEEVFLNIPLLLTDDKKYSLYEKRYYVLGHTNANRWLFIAFMIRTNKIRVISARDMNQKEERKYAKAYS